MSISRKDFLKKVGLLSVATVGTAALAACGGGSDKPAAPKKTAAAANDPCTDTSGIPAAELQKRTTFKYIEETEDPSKHCANCALYKDPVDGGCGGCALFAGPVTANGHCTAWAAKPDLG